MKNTLQFLLFFIFGSLFSQTTVHSLQELLPYLDDSNVHVILAPGTYTVTTKDVEDGMYTKKNHNDKAVLFMIEGNNSTYDFTDVTIEVDTEVFSSFGNIDVHEFNIYGEGNVLKNLKLVDVGSVYDAPRKGALNIAIDGKNNIVDGFDVESKGSSPYGYGDIFGKGGGAMVSLKKHSGILIRGDYNTLKNTKIFHKAFGHCVFMQAASHPTIDGCYIQGELRTTDDILKETGTIADDLDFMTTWGYKLPSGYMLALCEAGIRSYNAGSTVVDGEILERGSNDITVKNTTVINTRSGCTISQASGSRIVTNCTLIGNESGYAIGKGTVVNCKADAAYGPAFDGGSGITADITLIEPENGYYNGSQVVVSVTGANLTLKTSEHVVPSDLSIKMGNYRSLRHQVGGTLDYQLTTSFSGAKLVNYTNAAIQLASGSSNNTIETCGTVKDEGSNNHISESSNCSVEIPCYNTVENLEGECYDDMSGVEITDIEEGINEQAISAIHDGDWIKYQNVDLTGVVSVKVKAASTKENSSIEVRTGSVTGTLLATISVNNTSSLTSYQEFTADLNESIHGEKEIYFVFTGEIGTLFTLDKINFEQSACYTATYSAEEITKAVDYCGSFGVEKEGSLRPVVSSIHHNDYIRFSNYDFGNNVGYNGIKVSASSLTTGGTVEFRSGGVDGELLTSVLIENTGERYAYEVFKSYFEKQINGVHDLYVVFKGDNDDLFYLENFEFHVDVCYGEAYSAGEVINAAAYCEASEVEIEGSSPQTVGYINSGDYMRYSNVDFGNNHNYNTVQFLASSKTTGGTIQVRTGSTDGPLLTSVAVSGTGNWGNYQTFTGNIIGDVDGVHDIYIVFTEGSGGYLMNLESFQFIASLSADKVDFENPIAIYPNPAQDHVNINLSDYTGTAVDYKISSVEGRQIQQGSFGKSHQENVVINLADVKNGLYILQIKSVNSAIRVAKFIVGDK